MGDEYPKFAVLLEYCPGAGPGAVGGEFATFEYHRPADVIVAGGDCK